eukprot:TRINITY_DN7727_c0_g1_i3.p2 TRINITY_DN7727_c0_g1~~TRINITY_DN7727_c0_g1_i3.p2  ORF type:complete len:303 (+),score=16.43 TRINITY_DN7727_c0_g1_i3:460-1368(+)
MSRSRQFWMEARKSQPNLSEEWAFCLWLQSLLDNGKLKPVSASQYITYFFQSRKLCTNLFRRACENAIPTFEAHETKLSQAPTLKEVWETGDLLTGVEAAALNLQAMTAARWVDLRLLQRKHINLHLDDPDRFMITFVGGKTDRKGEGQSLLLPVSGDRSQRFLQWLRDQPTSPDHYLFQLSYSTYNEAIKKHLGVTSRFIRISSLAEVARRTNHVQAQMTGRHRAPSSTQKYIAREFWVSTQATKEGTSCLQREAVGGLTPTNTTGPGGATTAAVISLEDLVTKAGLTQRQRQLSTRPSSS